VDQWHCKEHVRICEDPLETYFDGLSAAVALVDPFPSMAGLESEEMASNMLECGRQIVRQLRPGARIYWFTDWGTPAC
jgi:hypothetical protein